MKIFPWQKPIRGTILNRSHPLAKGLVGAWLLNEGTGDKVFDYSGSGYDGVISGAVWQPNSLFFDETDAGDSVTIDSRLVISTWHEISIVAGVVYNETAQTAEYTIISNAQGSTQGSITMRIEPSGNRLEAWVVRHSNTTSTGNYSDLVFVDGEIHNVAVTYNSTSALYGYLDGVKSTSAGAGGSEIDHTISANPFTIGRTSYNSDWFNGQIIYVYMWSRELTQNEIRYLDKYPYAMFVQPSIGFSTSVLMDDVVIANYAPLIEPGHFQNTFYARGLFMQDFFPEYEAVVAEEAIRKATQSWIYRTQMRTK